MTKAEKDKLNELLTKLFEENKDIDNLPNNYCVIARFPDNKYSFTFLDDMWAYMN